MDREAEYRVKADECALRAAQALPERHEFERLARSWLDLAEQAARDKARGV